MDAHRAPLTALVLCAALLLVASCSREQPPLPERDPALPTHASALPPALLDAGATSERDATSRPVPSALVALRERALELPAQQAPTQRLAFSRKRLAVLGETELIVWELAHFKVVARAPVTGPRAVVAMADGAFVVVTDDATLRLEQHETRPATYPRMMLLPGSLLWPDRQAAVTLWTPAGGTLYQYRLPGPDETPIAQRLVPTAAVPLPDHDDGGFLGLQDGSFLFTAGPELRRLFAIVDGKSVHGPRPTPGRVPLRLVSARRLDQAWVAYEDGTLELVEVAGSFRLLERVSLGEPLFDIAAWDDTFAVVRVRHAPASPRTWTVALHARDGAVRFEHPLPPGPRPDTPRWVAEETRNRELAWAPAHPYLAVGGPTWLSVWHTATGKVVLTPEAAAQAFAPAAPPAPPSAAPPAPSAPAARAP